jgi:hypothetical protein
MDEKVSFCSANIGSEWILRYSQSSKFILVHIEVNKRHVAGFDTVSSSKIVWTATSTFLYVRILA